ncbi:ImmA/IrrE family metallo-endopeptidase [Corynebacterium glyciniphilum]|uniref:ImmA/IrrE family metallo-endopeptidase n=1 Tax=Corynebacterium glyciniphilum TaxID=1404244 RepID=UPI00264DA6A9|nr:ImmA/IrrE family metallo-endopeptidase [Corynebacterium glyciniphilum]MDN6705323.1 ImmA/IrrE family metallo-endopeptidase [Corynebacterium glyciniphilum]
MTISIPDPETYAKNHGIEVGDHHGGEKGRRHPDGSITLRSNLGPLARRCTLAHELGHQEHGHEPTPDPVMHARQERQADEYAARMLIDPDSYREAESLHGPHAGAIAWHLGVTRHLVEVWRTMACTAPHKITVRN